MSKIQSFDVAKKSGKKFLIIESEKEIAEFKNSPAPHKLVLFYGDWCGACKNFIPLFVPVLPTQDDFLLVAVVESKQMNMMSIFLKRKPDHYPQMFLVNTDNTVRKVLQHLGVQQLLQELNVLIPDLGDKVKEMTVVKRLGGGSMNHLCPFHRNQHHHCLNQSDTINPSFYGLILKKF
jgi:thiol-disulfide isomerase/thioredoxin